jgi:hypothetical protein
LSCQDEDHELINADEERAYNDAVPRIWNDQHAFLWISLASTPSCRYFKLGTHGQKVEQVMHMAGEFSR